MIVLFAASPVLVENVTYTWTKLFAGFFILLGTWLYLRGYQKQDGFRIVAAFASLCVGMLVHYSTGPYLLFFTLHYACTCWRRKNVIVEAAAIAAICLPILATWFAWSFYFYGWKTTVASNTSVSGTEQFSVSGNLQKIGANIVSTVFPHPLHISRHGFDKDYYQPNDLGYLRDYWFLILQPTFPAAIGTLGGLVALYILCKKLKILPPAQSIFWGTFVVFCARRDRGPWRTRPHGRRAHLPPSSVDPRRRVPGRQFPIPSCLGSRSGRRLCDFRFLGRGLPPHSHGANLFRSNRYQSRPHHPHPADFSVALLAGRLQFPVACPATPPVLGGSFPIRRGLARIPDHLVHVRLASPAGDGHSGSADSIPPPP